MQEVAFAQEIVSLAERVAREEGAPRVASITLELGEVARIDPETLRMAVEVAADGGVAHGCDLLVRRTPFIVSCPECAHVGEGKGEALGCPECGGRAVQVVSGREMRVISLEIEDRESREESGDA